MVNPSKLKKLHDDRLYKSLMDDLARAPKSVVLPAYGISATSVKNWVKRGKEYAQSIESGKRPKASEKMYFTFAEDLTVQTAKPELELAGTLMEAARGRTRVRATYKYILTKAVAAELKKKGLKVPKVSEPEACAEYAMKLASEGVDVEVTISTWRDPGDKAAWLYLRTVYGWNPDGIDDSEYEADEEPECY